ncbi:MAG: hypothetical protein AAFX05_13575, partial [Planctomycetota bacterium]
AAIALSHVESGDQPVAQSPVMPDLPDLSDLFTLADDEVASVINDQGALHGQFGSTIFLDGTYAPGVGSGLIQTVPSPAPLALAPLAITIAVRRTRRG